MLGRKKSLLENLSFILDILAGLILMIAIYFSLSYFRGSWESFLRAITGYPFNIQDVAHLKEQGWVFLVILLSLFISLKLNRIYQLDLFTKWYQITYHSIKSVGIGLGIAAIFFYFFSVFNVNRSLFFGFGGLFVLYQISKEIVFRQYLVDKYYRKNPLAALLVCGASDTQRWLDDFNLRPFSSVILKGILLTEGDKDSVPEILHDKIIGQIESLAPHLTQGTYDLVVLAESRERTITSQKVLSICEEQGIEVWYFDDFLSPLVSRPIVDEYGGKPVVVFKMAQHYEGQFIVKRFFDLGLSLFLIILLSPLYLIISLAIKLSSQGPIFFVQSRTGYRGKPFAMIKFRTMTLDAEDQLPELRPQNEIKGPVFKSGNDPRITPMGKFMRRFSLDELPQVFNVLKGEMSMVGPRPLPVYETENFEAFKDHRRYSVLPGVTGLWQVSGRNKIDDFSEWVRLDLEYIDHWSLWLDISILLRTIPTVLSGDGAT